jgi:hypothetical protein
VRYSRVGSRRKTKKKSSQNSQRSRKPKYVPSSRSLSSSFHYVGPIYGRRDTYAHVRAFCTFTGRRQATSSSSHYLTYTGQNDRASRRSSGWKTRGGRGKGMAAEGETSYRSVNERSRFGGRIWFSRSSVFMLLGFPRY